ncbi:hypothetical protein MGG_16553 [Pyricularia oryzae 70-15]|uniref:Uncharacterized protein n=2 Tax=Pyricularia oryzae TaxID=318829 RepID=G5EH78_PYRO7|nr:uncharacterized protein MGG_16553 [Pyricularia oryzae 70-15]XP_003714929.1 uncharacterized protein MGG_15793 [Pyricularia oryzae 70-15]EHA55122.1 hypothetical protein MGG_15793 [Pyricularia oryzae 70-15]EHA58509.1 hypothetical protein MGG_16553 [Pyricularia oryzae 70-15]
MKASNTLVALCVATAATEAYVITIYSVENCQGTGKRINVYDNSCSVPNFPGGAQSVRVEKYGAGAQKARFYRNNACVGNPHRGPWDAGKSDNLWEAGKCIEMGKGYTVQSFTSYNA